MSAAEGRRRRCCDAQLTQRLYCACSDAGYPQAASRSLPKRGAKWDALSTPYVGLPRRP